MKLDKIWSRMDRFGEQVHKTLFEDKCIQLYVIVEDPSVPKVLIDQKIFPQTYNNKVN